MPSQSRSRDRYRGRDTEYTHRRYPDDYDDNDDELDDLDDHDINQRRYRRDGYRRYRGESRPREQYGREAAHDEELLAEERTQPRTRTRTDRYERARGERSRVRDAGTERHRERETRSRRRTYEDDGRHRTRDGRRRQRRRETGPGEAARGKHQQSSDSTNSASHLLSADALARLGAQYEEGDRRERVDAADAARAEERSRRKKRAAVDTPEKGPRDRTKARVASGAYLEEGRTPEMEVRRRGGGGPAMEARWRKEGGWEGSVYGADGGRPFWKRKKWLIAIGAVILLLVIVIPVAVVVSKKQKHNDKPADPAGSQGGTFANSNLDGLSRDSIPADARGTVLDPWTWYDTTDFNVTFTTETVGGLSIMGLNSTWDDSARPNENVPPLNKPFPYGSQPIRGVNLGGWLSLEPFIVPSLFDSYSSTAGVIDEWTLSKQLGSSAASRLEKHYATFITEQDFADIRDAGLDHVRIQYSYWAVTTYDDDPYVAKTSWRYLLRAIEYCRKYGLRVKLDPHGIPGSQNGWNHSGRQGAIGWLNGTDGELNRNRSLAFHDSVSKFFAQDRYKNVVTIYGLANEPLMLALSVEDVLDWTVEVTKLVQKNGITAYVALHDGFLNLSKWKNMLKPRPAKMLLDTHQYTIFNTGQIVLNHTARINLVCNDWFNMIKEVNSTSSGFGPTICGEWSQADTDCAKYLNNVGRGTRWEGTFSLTDSTQYCPTAGSGPRCSCANANAAPSAYSAGYRKFLQTYAEAQMSAFETAQGWFYWTWRTESAAQWSYRTAWKDGFMPKKAYAPSFRCGDQVPDFGDLPKFY